MAVKKINFPNVVIWCDDYIIFMLHLSFDLSRDTFWVLSEQQQTNLWKLSEPFIRKNTNDVFYQRHIFPFLYFFKLET